MSEKDYSGGSEMVRGSISHIALTVSDLERSTAFYKKVFEFIGFKSVEVPESTQEAMKTRLKAWAGPGYSISIRPSKGKFAHRAHDRNAPGFNHLAFTAENRSDVEKLYVLETGGSDNPRRAGGISVLAWILRGLFRRS
jgi:catechol 2,3-dioxygenase-like lactoylglutathione lyase family enzyme